jgi:hypothetical protein
MKQVAMPERIKSLPTYGGKPIPFFVSMIDGKPDFRVVNALKVYECCYTKACFICGQKLGTYLAFVIGPMCTVSRISAEPPSHLECAQYAVKVCPFLAHPWMSRRVEGLPDDVREPPGAFAEYNPGCTAIWVTKSYRPIVHDGGLLFRIGEPTTWWWYKEGELASREDVVLAFDHGVRRFYELKAPADSVQLFEADLEKARKLWPMT